MIIKAIDPGLDGAIVSVATYGDPTVCAEWTAITMPVFKVGARSSSSEYHLPQMAAALRAGGVPDVVVIEEVGKRPDQSVQSMITTGYGHGLLRGMLTVLAWPVIVISPRKWQGHVLGKVAKGEVKEAALRMAKTVAPGLPYETKRGRKLYGVSDAVCMAWWYATGGTP